MERSPRGIQVRQRVCAAFCEGWKRACHHSLRYGLCRDRLSEARQVTVNLIIQPFRLTMLPQRR
jgi:hypothetical protein